MSIEAARAKFSDVFTTAWATAYPTVPIAYENRKFAQPVNQPWASFSVAETYRKRMAIGTTKRFVRVYGMVIVELYVPADAGTKALGEMCDSASLALEEKNFTLSTTRAVTTLTAQRSNDGKVMGFSKCTVMVPYWLDEAFVS